MKKVFTALFFFISISLFSQDEKRLALVIGNANYEKGELKNPVNDARLIASTLDSLDFDVILKENLATKRDMTAAIREFGSKRSEYDVAFVYYAGHGIQVDDENFLLPTKEVFEEEFDVMDYGVSVQSVMRYLEAQTNEVNILILDACRDNPYESNWNNTRSLKGGGLAKIPPPTGSLIAFSTDSGQTAPDGNGDNSVYTISLAKNMLLEDTSIDQLFRNVRAEVLTQTDGIQRPVEATQLTGQTFYLNPKSLDRIFNQIEGLYKDGKNEEVIYSIENNNELLYKGEFLKKLLKSYLRLDKIDLAFERLNKVLINNQNLNTLKVAFEFYVENSKATKAYEIAKRIYNLESNEINLSRLNWAEYQKANFNFSDVSKEKYENDINLNRILNNLKSDLITLNNKSDLFDEKERLELMFRISKSLIYTNSFRIDRNQNLSYFDISFKSIDRLVNLYPNISKYHYHYAALITWFGYIDHELKTDSLRGEYNFMKDEEKFIDSLYKISYDLNIDETVKITKAHFNNNILTKLDKENQVLPFLNKLVNKRPNNLTYLKLRGDTYKKFEEYELSINDYKNYLSKLDTKNDVYEIVEVASEINIVYQESLGDDTEGRKILSKCVNLIDTENKTIKDFDDEEKYMYGYVFNTLAQYAFKDLDYDLSRKYLDQSKFFWNNEEIIFENVSLYDLLNQPEWLKYTEQYGHTPLIEYLVRAFFINSDGKPLDSYLNWISGDIDISKNIHFDIYTNLGFYTSDDHLIELINLTAFLKDDLVAKTLVDDFKNHIKELKKDEPTDGDIKELEFLLTTLNCRIGINCEKEKLIFEKAYSDELIFDDENQITKLSMHLVNILYLNEMYQIADDYIQYMMKSENFKMINSTEFFYKAAYIKLKLNEKFESYLLYNKAKELLSNTEENIIVEFFREDLSIGLAFDFDGITILTQDHLLTLEKEIKN